MSVIKISELSVSVYRSGNEKKKTRKKKCLPCDTDGTYSGCSFAVTFLAWLQFPFQKVEEITTSLSYTLTTF